MADLGHEPRIDPPSPGDQPGQETTWCDECGHPLAEHDGRECTVDGCGCFRALKGGGAGGE